LSVFEGVQGGNWGSKEATSTDLRKINFEPENQLKINPINMPSEPSEVIFRVLNLEKSGLL
jgi:hypothetical protein